MGRTRAVEIRHERYGERSRFSSIAAAQRAIRACGGDFVATRLRLTVDGRVLDDRGEVVGRELSSVDQ